MKKSIITLIIVFSLFVGKTFAEGYATNLQGVKQIGMGHTGVALNMDVSSLQFNPGALVFMPNKYGFSAGASLTLVNNKYTSNAGVTEQNEASPKTPFYFYGGAKINDKLAVGLGVYTPFGNSLDWGDNWSGKYLVQNISMHVVFFQPTLSYAITNKLAIGAGPIVAMGSYEINKAVPMVTPVGVSQIGTMGLKGDAVAYGYNVGLQYKASDKLSLGVSYRSQIDVNADGEANPEIDPAVIALLTQGAGLGDPVSTQKLVVLTSDGAKSTLPLPASLNFGAAYNVSNKLILAADVNYVFWSAYKSLTFMATNSNFASAGEYVMSEVVKDWKNSLTYRIGAQYTVNNSLELRAGFYYDQTPTQADKYTPETPGADKIGLSAGCSYNVTKGLSVDISLLYVEGQKRHGVSPDNMFEGDYKNTGFLPGLGVSYSF